MMSVCRYCRYKSEEYVPLYRMCCEANMTYRCIDLVNRPDDQLHQDDFAWLQKNEEERSIMTTFHPLTIIAYKCYHDMYTLLEKCEEIRWGHKNLDYSVLKIINVRWNEWNDDDEVILSPRTVYLNIQVIDGRYMFRKLNINDIDNEDGEECFTIYTSEKTRIDSLRNTIRDEQEERQIANDYANVQRRLVNAASRLLLNMRDPSVERALIHEFNAVAEEDESLPDLVPDSDYETDTDEEEQELITSDKVIEAIECAICFENLGETNKIILRCGHQFCGDCIFRHYQCKNGSNCPSCRAKFV